MTRSNGLTSVTKMKRPLVVTITGWLFMLVGTVGFIYHFTEVNIESVFANDAVWVLFVRLLAIAGGALTIRGANLGRWLILIWMAYHVVLSYFHPFSELITHIAILAVISFALFNSKANAFFKNKIAT